MKVIKSSHGIPRLSYTGRDDRHFVPFGLYIVRTVSGKSISTHAKSDIIVKPEAWNLSTVVGSMSSCVCGGDDVEKIK